jgi:hypothetical protein
MRFGETYARLRQGHSLERLPSPGLRSKVIRCVGVAAVLSLAVAAAQSVFVKTITVTPGVKVQAIATWSITNCNAVNGVGSYTVTVAPAHGVLAFGTANEVIVGCPSTSIPQPAAIGYYTWTGGTGATSDYFQLYYSGPNGTQYDDITVNLAGPPPDVFKVNYFSNNIAAAPDATVRIDNPGLTYGNLCALIYVFDADQQLSECCGCMETHNGLRTLSVRSNLTSNPLTGVLSTNGMIKIVSSLPGSTGCDPTGNVAPTANLRAWVTHIGNPVGSAYPMTETESSDSTLGAGELSGLESQCAFVRILGSGHGTCSCGTGD